MANIDLRTREGRAMKAAAEAARQAASAGKVLNEVSASREQSLEPPPDQDHRVEPNFEQQEPIKPRNEPRERALREIEEREARNRGETVAAAPEEPLSEAPSEPDSPPATEPVAAAPEAQIAPAAPKVIRVKVDGVEFDAPEEDVEAYGGLKPYQIAKASENRLAKANEIIAQNRQLQSQLAAMVQAQTPKPVTKTDAQFIQEKIDTIRFGTPEESAAAMQEVLTRNRPNVDQNQIVNRAIVAMQQQAAEQAFVTEFQDVVSNPLLLKLTIQLKNERLAQLKQVPDWSNFYRSIGNEVRGAIGRPSQPATPTQGSPAGAPSQPDREARKASITTIPTAAARAAAPETPKPETRDEILNEMRKRRGLPTG